jgi:arylsulfatase A-like enzyme
MTDNGGLSLTPHRSAPAHSQNLPLKAGKGSVYEGGIRVPMIVSWPEQIKPGTIADQYVMIEDFFPTILAVAGIKNYEMVQEIDGVNMLPIFSNPSFSDTSRALMALSQWRTKADRALTITAPYGKVHGNWFTVCATERKNCTI